MFDKNPIELFQVTHANSETAQASIYLTPVYVRGERPSNKQRVSFDYLCP